MRHCTKVSLEVILVQVLLVGSDCQPTGIVGLPRGNAMPTAFASPFRMPDSSLTIPRTIKRYGIVSLKDDDAPMVVLRSYRLCVSVRWFFVPGLVHFMELLTFLFVGARYPSRVILAGSSRRNLPP
jgi:hypothetical protein